jgi:hypothetical protein
VPFDLPDLKPALGRTGLLTLHLLVTGADAAWMGAADQSEGMPGEIARVLRGQGRSCADVLRQK